MERVFRDSVITIGAKLLVMMLGILTSVVIARSLGTVWRGYFGLIMLPQAFALVILPLGIDRGNILCCAKEPDKLGDLARNSFWAALVLGTGAFLLMLWYTTTNHFAVFSGNVHPGFFLIIAATFPLLLVSRLLDAILHGRDLLLIRNLKEVFINLSILIATLVGFYVLHKGLLAPVGANIAVALIGCGTSIYLINRYVVKFSLRGFNWAYLKKNFPFGLKNHLAGAAVLIVPLAIIFLAPLRIQYDLKIEQMSQIAFLSLAVGIFEKGLMMPRSIVFAVLPKLTSANAAEVIKSTMKISRYNILITLLVFAILFYLIKPLAVLMFGHPFIGIEEPFRGLVPGALFLSIGEVLAAGLFARGKTNAILYAGAAGLITAVIAGWFWLFNWSVYGGALAISVGFLVYAIVLLIAFAIESPFRSREMFVLSDDDVAEIKEKFWNNGKHRV